MAPWWKKKLPLRGIVLFRGNLPPQPGEFAFLQQQGIAITPEPANDRARWALKLAHPEWGEASLACPRDLQAPPREIIEFQRLSPAEKERALLGEVGLFVEMEPQQGNVLRDRKLLLRYLGAIMAGDGVAALDMASQLVWSREMLDDELSHDADLDVEAIFSLHAIYEEDQPPYWIHSHGLQEIGEFDFDILDPSEHLDGDIYRAIAFAIVEQKLIANTEFPLAMPKGTIRPVEIEQFLAQADSRYRRQIGDGFDEMHRKKHYVLCEPESGFFSRLFARGLRPSRFLSHPVENSMLTFTNEATELMAERARQTYPVLRQLAAEFADLELPVIVKLGYRTDPGSPTEHENLWFKVEGFAGEDIDATLLNQPFFIERMKEGQRSSHSAELLSDWTIMTPAGPISPRAQIAARAVRANREKIRQMMQQAMRQER